MAEPQRAAVVTGGGTGIGRAIASAFAERGDRVVITGRRKDRLDDAAAEINAAVAGSPVSCVQADLTDPDQVETLAAAVRADLGTLDVLVNNAGSGYTGPLETLRDIATKHTTVYLQNVVTAALATAALGPLMRRPGGRIIMISSKAALGPGGDAAYGASKAALNRLVIGLASEFGPDGVTVNAVSPGFVPDTELYAPRGIPREWRTRIVAGIAVGRGGEPAEIAAMVCAMASPASSFVNGTVIDVDGGLRAMT
jgi:3-oxoacyl-[acyl-carrier protein] reductase